MTARKVEAATFTRVAGDNGGTIPDDAHVEVEFDLGVPVAYWWRTPDGRSGRIELARPSDGSTVTTRRDE